MRPTPSLSRVALAAALCLGAASAAAQEAPGRTVFMVQGCAQCHAVPAADIQQPAEETVTAPVLEGLVDKYRRRWLRRWLRRDKVYDGLTHLKKFEGTDEELEVLVDWLLEQ